MRQRIDLLLVAKGLAPSRQRAKHMLEQGIVSVEGCPVTKASASFEEDVNIALTGEDIPFVSRGGLKLAKAFEVFELNAEGLVCADIGASTGGFTDCLLQHGAAYVYAVDSGHDQLDERLRRRENVCNMEGVNARSLTPELFERPIDLLTMDVSFISITKVLPALYAISRERAEVICLIKPQFEAGREFVGKKGVVRDRNVHLRIIREVTAFAGNLGFGVLGLTYSPIKGPEGNIEYLMHLKKGDGTGVTESRIRSMVDQAFSTL
jgi:23S rRNA (cytidine1920-2'-O)/16S rRNA (cytidine1409-2'-O)-methyltransferase